MNVYGQFLNLPPHQLSNVESIFLLGTINCLNMGESSTERAIYPIFTHIEAVNRAIAAFGLKIKIAYFAGDTPISQSMCGCVESVGNANYPCRQCLIHKNEILHIKKHGNCRLRTKMDSWNLANTLDKKGIVAIPNFWNFDFFDAIEQTPMDVMHILLEGVCRKQIMWILDEWVQTKRADLSEINRCIQNFPYQQKHAKNKISDITQYDLTKKELVLSASQMKTFILLLPFIFSNIIDITHTEYK